ncbi:hypothetical protein H8356DRAFT_1075674 [Neocallimastix lanati (nom. inval.)]|nr:hypothetical protein H8356DRAFT_1075674 [Neocallimastix sp. JGI-2020a]
MRNKNNSTEVEYRFNLKVGLNFVRRYRNELTGILLNYSFDPALYIDYSKIDLSNNIVENTRLYRELGILNSISPNNIKSYHEFHMNNYRNSKIQFIDLKIL